MAKEEEPKKIIVDEDWKQQAQREKEVLAAQEEQEKQKKAAEGPPRGGPMPRGDLAALISMLTTQALFAMGFLQIKGEEDREPDLDLARYNIDLLQAIEEKTKGNLTPEEQQLLKNTLNDLRMGYVSVMNQLSAQEDSGGTGNRP
jgi:DNA replication initiation complex subunit (GINS family)